MNIKLNIINVNRNFDLKQLRYSAEVRSAWVKLCLCSRLAVTHADTPTTLSRLDAL